MPKKQSRNNYSTLLPCFQQISCFWFVFSLNKNAIAKNSGHLTTKYDYSSRNSYSILQPCFRRSHFLVRFFTLKNLLQRILVILPQNMIIAAETITVFHSYVSADLMFLVCFFTLTNFCCKEFWSSYPNMGIAAAQPMLPNPTLCTYCGVHY